MNKKVFVLSMVLILLLFALSLSACSNNFPLLDPSTESTAPSVVTEPTTEPTEPYTGPHYATSWPEFADVRIYPMDDAKFTEAVRVFNEAMESTKNQDHVISFEVHWSSYDPYATDHHIRNILSFSPVDGWEEKQYYDFYLYFAVNYSIDVDSSKSPASDQDHATGMVLLIWDAEANTWIIDQLGSASTNHNIPYDSEILAPEEAAKIYSGDHRILASYRQDQQTYIYLLNEQNQEIILHKGTPNS